jgi:hypothetical protein
MAWDCFSFLLNSDVDINIEPIESTIPVNVKGVLRSIHKRGMRDRIFFYQDTTLVLHARVSINRTKK